MKKIYKVALISIGIIICGLSYVGVTYSLWVKTFTSTDTNVVKSGCFTITFEEKTKSVSLTNTYPISDTKALNKLKPFQIKLTNTCDTTEAGYSITLNTVTISGSKLPDEKVKFALGENGSIPSNGLLLSKAEINIETNNIDISNLKTSYIISTGTLERGKSKTFELYLWLDEETTNEFMNHSFEAGIVVTSYSKKGLTLANFGIKDQIVTKGTGIYEITHNEADITAVLTSEEKNNLKQMEYRYAGQNPNNYVTFNNELWRIIGLVNTPEGQRIKLVRNESIGNYSWDSSENSINNGYGVNEWSQADLKELLNSGAYYNRTNGLCYNNKNNGTKECDFSTTGLLEESKDMIDTITWNVGSNGKVGFNAKTKTHTNYYYDTERSNLTSKTCSVSNDCNDSVTRTNTWKGKVAVIYATDYNYATSGSSLTSRDVCLKENLSTFSNSQDCFANDWLHQTNIARWLLMPRSISSAFGALFLDSTGIIKDGQVWAASGIRPSIYLKEHIKIANGDGSLSNPYQLK